MRMGVLFSNSNARCPNHVFSAFCCHVIMSPVPGRYCVLVPMPPHLCWRKHDYVSSRHNDALGYWAIPLPKRPAGSISSLRRGDVRVSFPVVFDRFYGMCSLFHLHIITFLHYGYKQNSISSTLTDLISRSAIAGAKPLKFRRSLKPGSVFRLSSQLLFNSKINFFGKSFEFRRTSWKPILLIKDFFLEKQGSDHKVALRVFRIIAALCVLPSTLHLRHRFHQDNWLTGSSQMICQALTWWAENQARWQVERRIV